MAIQLDSVWPIGYFRSTHENWHPHADAEPLLTLLEELILDLAKHDAGITQEVLARLIAEVVLG